MCFGAPSPPQPAYNPAPYSLDQSHTAVTASVAPATEEEMAKLAPEPAPAVPLRTQNTGIYYESR